MDGESASILKNIYNVKTIIPSDIVFGIPNLPFKVSIGMILEIAYWAVKLSSFQDAENYFLRTKNISISNDTIREIVNYVGAIVYEADCYEAEHVRKRLKSCTINAQYNKEVVLYLMDRWCSIKYTGKKTPMVSHGKRINLLLNFQTTIYFFGKIKREKDNIKLKEGKWKNILEKLKSYRDRTPKSGCVNLYTYIINNKDNIDYPAYKAKGWFVGSGAIESDNKIVLQNRLKLPGMRGNVSIAQYILLLKAKLYSISQFDRSGSDDFFKTRA